MNQSFKQFELRDFLLAGLHKMGIAKPTPVQQQAIPAIIKGRDVVGQSQTGTGKTLAYVLPVLQKIEIARRELQVLILGPTRELTRQIAEVVGHLTEDTGIDVVLIQGGVDINRQIQKLRRNPQIIVGTPGRVVELVNQEKLTSYTAKVLVLDEADTMLEMGFREDIEQIIQKIKKDAQILLFAATLPPKVVGMVNDFMNRPFRIEINPGEAVSTIQNVYFRARNNGKEDLLLDLVRLYNPYLGIVFVRKKEQVDDLVTQLRQSGVDAEGLYGDLQRGRRKQVMQRFREAEAQILVATDIASRGLDIEGVTHIFNFDLPINVDQYIHRVGRTGRMGDTGTAINIITAADQDKLRFFEARLGLPIIEMVIKNGSIQEKPASRRGDKTRDEEKSVNGRKKAVKKFTGPNAKKKAAREAMKKAGRAKAGEGIQKIAKGPEKEGARKAGKGTGRDTKKSKRA